MMKTTQKTKNTSSNTPSSKPFFSKNWRENYSSQAQNVEAPFFPPIQRKKKNDDSKLEGEVNEKEKLTINRKSLNGQKSTTPIIQRKTPKETLTDYKRYRTISGMTILQLNSYAKKQADWHASPYLSNVERDNIRLVLGFSREPGLLAGLGRMQTGILHQEMVNQGLTVAKKYLKIYTKAVSSQNPFQLMPINTPKDAINTGKNLDSLINTFPGYMLKSAMNERMFDLLVRFNYIPDLVNYYSTAKPHPLFAALNGMDFGSYYNMKRSDGIDPITFYKAPLIGNIRNYHRFQKEALDHLILNFNDTSKTKPLTLILHTAIDHNAAFHRDPKLTDVIKESSINTLMIEGKETLANVKSQIKPIAKKYGVNDKIDQVMFAGHGNARSMQLGGKVKDDGTGKLEEVSDSLDLKNNPTATDNIMIEVLDNMDMKGVKKKDLQPHRRIVFNACLTNSNAVRTTLKGTSVPAVQAEIKNYILKNPSLATYLQNMAKKNKNRIKSVGSNASFSSIDLIDPTTKDLDLIDNKKDAVGNRIGDVELTSSKIKYVEFGKDPGGAMRAVVESWADNLTTCKSTMQKRIAASTSKKWKELLIKTCYDIVINNYWMRPGGIILMEQVADIVSHLIGEPECRPANFRGVDTLGNDFKTLMKALSGSTEWNSLNYIPLVMYQGWMTADPSDATIKSKFLTHLSTYFTCQSARKFVDINYLNTNGHLPNLLGTKGNGQIMLALLGILSKTKPVDCKNYLLSELNSTDTFDPVKGISAKLDGLAIEDQILIAIGKLSAPSKTTTTTTTTSASKDANVLIHGDAKNKEYVNSVTYKGKVNASPQANIYTKPDAKSGKLKPLTTGQNIYVLGEVNAWWAIEYMHGANTGTAFIQKSDVKIL